MCLLQETGVHREVQQFLIEPASRVQGNNILLSSFC